MISRDDVHYLAALARLRLAPEEEARMADDLGAILDYVAQLQEVDTEGVEPLLHVLDLQNVFRADVRAERLAPHDALAGAPDHDGTFFRVPKVIE